jgi:hypothetical protein
MTMKALAPPRLFDLPEGRLETRRPHLVAELTRDAPHLRARRLLLPAAVAAATALVIFAGPVAAESRDPPATLALIQATRPPTRDLADLRARFISPARGLAASAASAEALWVNDIVNHSYRAVLVDLAYRSPHADWFVERGRGAGDLTSAVDFFEARTFPRVTELTGVQWPLGGDGQPRLAIFNGTTPGVAGYMSAGDFQPRAVFPYSNEQPIVYLSLDSLRPGTSGYNATLAHELEHLAHYTVNPTQEGWLDEGLAELVSNLVMEAPPPALSSFRAHPDTQLTAWSEKPWEARAHYEAAYLWARYLMERGGGPSALPDLIGAGGQGLVTADRYARRRGLAGGVDGLFRDWLIANLVDDAPQADGRYGYQGLDQRSAVVGTLRLDGIVADDQVHQFAADAYELAPAAPAALEVEVATTVPLIAADDVRGSLFWSLRGDNLDTRLTRHVDLGGLSQATLRYRVWYDLETDYDICYALASTDGLSWLPLSGRWTTDRDKVGLALGPGYTGRSGTPPAWLDEQIDLTPFAGGPLDVRFECVTDQGYSGPGFALDDLAIPELGFSDDGESDPGWIAEGFVRAPNAMAQPALVLLVENGPSGLSVRQVPIESDGRGHLELSGDGTRSVAIVAGLAPRTLEPMSYRLWLAAPER